jgi:hypothetical protein
MYNALGSKGGRQKEKETIYVYGCRQFYTLS